MILSEIERTEKKLQELREQLPSALKSVYVFRLSKPQTRIFLYCDSEEEAASQFNETIQVLYPGGDFTLCEIQELDPVTANREVASGYGIYTVLSPEQADALAEDVREELKGRTPDFQKRNGFRSMLAATESYRKSRMIQQAETPRK